MAKILNEYLIKREPYTSIVLMLRCFKDKGLKSNHFRYELIGPDTMHKNEEKNDEIAQSVNDDLKEKRKEYIDKISKNFLKNNDTPGKDLDRALRKLREKRIVRYDNKIYYLNDEYHFERITADDDIKNINRVFNNKLKHNITVVEDLGLHIYGPSFVDLIRMNDLFEKELNDLFVSGCEDIEKGTIKLQNILTHISSQIKINTWKEVLAILSNEEIPLIERQVLLLFFCSSMNNTYRLIDDFQSWFYIQNKKNPFSLTQLANECDVTIAGKIKLPEKKLKLRLQKPDLFLIKSIKLLNSNRDDYYHKLSKLYDRDFSQNVSDSIISLLVLPWITSSFHTMFTISYPSEYMRFNIPDESGEYGFIATANELKLKKSVYEDRDYSFDSIKSTSTEELSDSLVDDYKPLGDCIHSYKKERIIAGLKNGERERIFQQILKDEGKDNESLFKLLKAQTTMDIIDMFNPGE